LGACRPPGTSTTCRRHSWSRNPREEAIERAKNFIASTDAIRLFGDDDDPTLQLRVAYEHQGVFATKELVEKEDYVFEFVKSGIGQAPAFLMKFNLMTSLPK